MVSLRRYLPAFISGILLAASFPRPGLGVAAWAALVPLFLSVSKAGPGDSLKRGFVAGLTFYLLSIYWIAGTMSGYGGLPRLVSIALLVALSAYLALYFGAFAWLLSKTESSLRIPAVIAAPVYWSALELLRNYLLSGFPWDQLGYSQSPYPLVIQAADVTGVYGLSAAIVFVNAALAGIILAARDKNRPRIPAIAGAAAAVIVVSALLGYGHYRLSHPPVKNGRFKVALVQGNIEQFAKWDPAYQDEVFDTYRTLTLEAARERPGIIIWPETATPFYYQDDAHREPLEMLAVEAGTYILTGSPAFVANPDGTFTDYNSAFLISPQGKTVGRYDKMHLVPFGEYVPLKKLLPFVSKMVTSIGDFGTGTGYTVMHASRGSFGTAICFEAIFPELVRMFALDDADYLVNITNDAWFGDTAAPYQHFDMAIMRAVENRRTLVRAANTGITGIINPSGIVTAKTGIFTRGYIVRDIELVDEKSFYTLHGDLFAYACAGIALVFLVLILKHPGYNKKKTKAKGGL